MWNSIEKKNDINWIFLDMRFLETNIGFIDRNLSISIVCGMTEFRKVYNEDI